jgi:hypothetical protein
MPDRASSEVQLPTPDCAANRTEVGSTVRTFDPVAQNGNVCPRLGEAFSVWMFYSDNW